jgi:hypothetical protein
MESRLKDRKELLFSDYPFLNIRTSALAFVEKIDAELAAKCRSRGCPCCGGKPHSAAYFRVLRHAEVVEPLRFQSFCCSKVGCRRRTRPLSVIFAGRSSFAASLILFFGLLRGGRNVRVAKRLAESVAVSISTAKRWLKFWASVESNSNWWRRLSGLHFLSGKSLADLWARLSLSSSAPEETLIRCAADLWPEITLSGAPAPPAELGLTPRSLAVL